MEEISGRHCAAGEEVVGHPRVRLKVVRRMTMSEDVDEETTLDGHERGDAFEEAAIVLDVFEALNGNDTIEQFVFRCQVCESYAVDIGGDDGHITQPSRGGLSDNVFALRGRVADRNERAQRKLLRCKECE